MATFYDILTYEGDWFFSNHANLLLVATADQNYFTDVGGSLSGVGYERLKGVSLGRIVLATMPDNTVVVVGGKGDLAAGTYSSDPNFDMKPDSIYGGEAIQFRGNGTVSFSAAAGPRSNSDKFGVGADRKIIVSVDGVGADSYGVIARHVYNSEKSSIINYGDLTIKGDAAAAITVRGRGVDGGDPKLRLDEYFLPDTGVMVAAYRAMGDLEIKKDFTGTLVCEAESDSVYIPIIGDPAKSYGFPSSAQSSFMSSGHYVYGNGFGANGIAANNITIDGEMNSFASISTAVKDYDATFYYTSNSMSPQLASIQSVGISATWDVKFGNVSGSTISTDISNATAYFKTFQDLSLWFGKGAVPFTRCRIQSIGVKANHIIADGDLAPDTITASADSITGINCNIAGIFASNQVDAAQTSAIGGIIDVAGDIGGNINVTVDSIRTSAEQYSMSLDFRSRQWAAGIAAESATSEKVYEMFEEWSEPARSGLRNQYYKSNYEYGIISAAGKIRPNITIEVTDSGTDTNWFYAYGMRAATIKAADVSPNVNITIDAASHAMGIGLFVRNGIYVSDGEVGQSVMDGNIIINRNGVGIMGFGRAAMNLLIKGSIEAEYAVVSGIRDKGVRSMSGLLDDQNYKLSVFRDGATYYLFGQNDVLELAAGATVKGNIDLGDGQNTITIDSNASLVGAVDSTLGTLRTNFKLNGDARTDAIVTLTEKCSLTESVGSVTVNADNARQGTYTLIDASGIGLSFDGQKISVSYGGESYFLAINGAAVDLDANLAARAEFVGDKITFTIGDTGNDTRHVTGLAAKVDARKNEVTVSWDNYTVGGSYQVEYEIVAEDGSVTDSGTIANVVDNRHVFTGVDAGRRVNFKVAAAGYADSVSEEFSSDVMPESSLWRITSMQQQKLFVESSEQSLLYSLNWSAVSGEKANMQPLSHYEIQYVENADLATAGAPDWSGDDAVTKVSTDTSLIISGLRDVNGFWWRVRPVDVTGNAGNWSRNRYVYVGSDNTPPVMDLSQVSNSGKFDVDTGKLTLDLAWKLAEDDGAGVDAYTINITGSLEFSYDISLSELLQTREKEDTLDNGVVVNCKLSDTGENVECRITLPNGAYNWSLSVSDLAGNTLERFAFGSLVGDLEPPVFSSGAAAKSTRTYDRASDSYFCRVNLSWGKATDNSGDAAFDRYEVVVRDADGKEVLAEVIDDVNTTSYSFDSTQQGNYIWFVRAYDKFGNVAQTGDSAFTVDFEAPSGYMSSLYAPEISARYAGCKEEEVTVLVDNSSGSGGPATMGGQSKYETRTVVTHDTSPSEVSVTLNFLASFTDNMSEVRYEIQVADNPQFGSENGKTTRTFTIAAGDSSAHTLTLDADTAWNGSAAGQLLGMDDIYYRVRAVDAVGNATQWHVYGQDMWGNTPPFHFAAEHDCAVATDKPGVQTVVDNQNPSSPANLKFARSDRNAVFSWTLAKDAFGIKNYKVNISGANGGKSYTFDAVSHEDGASGIKADIGSGKASFSTWELAEGKYSWSVTARDYSGRTATANGGSFTLDWTSPVLKSPTVTVVGKDALFKWTTATDNLSGIDHYEIEYWIGDSTNKSFVGNIKTTSHTVYNDTFGSYNYNLCAVDKAGNKTAVSGTYTISERSFAPLVEASTTAPTNKNVTITATFSSDSAKRQFSLDGKTWNNYTKALTAGKNGTYYFRAIDKAGNKSEVTTYKVTNIDKVAPAAPKVKASTAKATNQDVTLTVTFPADSAKKQYSTDNKTWKSCSDTVAATKNGTYYFRATDAAGNVSKVTSIKVANIDKVAPDAPTVKASNTKATNKNITLTATFSKDSSQKQYSTDNQTWKTYSKALTVSQNGTYYFRGVDAAGNVSKVKSIKVANIDKVAPDAPTVKASNTKLTNKNITVTATFSKDSATKQYSTDNKTWKTYSKALSVSKNGTYYFRGVDAAGNVSKVTSLKVANIDKTAPAAPTVKLSNTKATNQDVTLTVTFSGDSAKKQYSTDNKSWQNCTDTVTATKNGTYYFRGTDAAGNVSKVTTVKVANIDKTAPAAPTVKLSSTKAAKSITVTATFSKDSAKKQYSTDGTTWKTYSKALTITANGTYYFRGVDAAGNKSKVRSAKVSNIVDTGNNSWANATELKDTVLGALDNALDKVDYYDVGDVAKLMLDMEAGKAKVTFCDADRKAVAAQMERADGSIADLASFTLASGDQVSDHITLGDLGEAVKYLKIESAASGVNSYRLAKLA